MLPWICRGGLTPLGAPRHTLVWGPPPLVKGGGKETFGWGVRQNAVNKNAASTHHPFIKVGGGPYATDAEDLLL